MHFLLSEWKGAISPQWDLSIWHHFPFHFHSSVDHSKGAERWGAGVSTHLPATCSMDKWEFGVPICYIFHMQPQKLIDAFGHAYHIEEVKGNVIKNWKEKKDTSELSATAFETLQCYPEHNNQVKTPRLLVL